MIKLSSIVELVGFACLVRMGFLFHAEAGWGTAGVSLLIMGRGTDDDAVVSSVQRARQWVQVARFTRKARRASKKG